ncbi:uncharacterized protein FTOL_02170 [Fusarium torulosum]|uniref:Ubiquitin-like domain-containing protein n=1 Tax=Fusarium torulosum TaxID=33205 RepID=A0AAE8M1K7_9HYPO|nr:uncharacterized protein FTOL_02170 [Fusarium torulosum]
MFPESYDFSELSQKEATRILELLNDDRRRVETKLEKLELSVANAKVRGTDRTEDLDAEDASEMSARLAGLDGDPLSGFKDEQDFIKFKDAVGRKFIFPFHMIRTWTGMHELIEQAFMHVDVLGPRVMEGQYDLIGPDGEIILPSIWEQVIQPDWAVTMTMRPMEQNTSEEAE